MIAGASAAKEREMARILPGADDFRIPCKTADTRHSKTAGALNTPIKKRTCAVPLQHGSAFSDEDDLILVSLSAAQQKERGSGKGERLCRRDSHAVDAGQQRQQHNAEHLEHQRAQFRNCFSGL